MASLVTSFVQPHESPRNDAPQWPINLHVGLSKVGESVILSIPTARRAVRGKVTCCRHVISRLPDYGRAYSGRRIPPDSKGRSLRYTQGELFAALRRT